MADAPQVQKGQGADQLPQGGAKQVNEASQDVSQVGQAVAATDATANAQQDTITQLQQSLATGQINQKQYDDAISHLFVQRVNAGGFQSPEMQQQAQQFTSAQHEQAARGKQVISQLPPQNVDLSGTPQDMGPPTGMDESQQFMMAPRPGDQQQRPNYGAVGQAAAMPPDLVDGLPALIQAAQAPNAPPQLLALLALLSHYVQSSAPPTTATPPPPQ